MPLVIYGLGGMHTHTHTHMHTHILWRNESDYIRLNERHYTIALNNFATRITLSADLFISTLVILMHF